MEAPPRRRRRLWPWILAGAAVLIVTIILLWRYWPYYRAGDGAMAPAFLGPHVIAACDNCGFELALGVPGGLPERRQDAPRTAPCPNCSAACPVPPPSEAESGDMIVLNAWARPGRRDVVAYRPTSSSETIHLSRVVGLPGQRVEIRAGDIHIDGSRLTRRPDEAAELWQLVHDGAHLPTSPQKDGPAWVPATGSPWRLVDGRWAIETPAAEPSRLEFRGSILSGVPYAGLYAPGGAGSLREAPVGDVRLTVRLRRFSGQGRLRLEWRRGDLEVNATVEANGDATLHAAGAATRGEVIPLAEASRLQLAILDGRAYLAADGTLALDAALPERTDIESSACRLAVEATGCALEIARLRIERDVHYLRNPSGEPARDEPVALGPGQYFLLGDNSPNCLDSRWHGPIAADNILGVVQNLSR